MTSTASSPASERPCLGISACLLGQAVRFNGGHKHAPVCTQLLGALFDWQPVCPETAIGLGVLRPALRLLASDAGLRLVDSRTAQHDVTAPMQAFAQGYAASALAGLSGFVFMQKSPSCGLYRVPQYRADGHAGEHAAGLFAAAIRAAQPLLPCEEAGRLHDPLIREHFASRVLAYHAWQQLRAGTPQPADLLDFHARHKYQLMAHSPAGLRALGRLLADLRTADFAARLDAYAEGFFSLLAQQPSRRGHANALQHIRGYLKRCGLRPAEQQRLDAALADYRHGVIPRMVPLALLRQHFDRHPHPYIARQVYLNPRVAHPVLLHGA